jgi:hypothetical protein
VEARASVDRAVTTTGDVITYTVEVDRDPAYEVEVPEPGAEIAGFRIFDLGREEPRETDGRVVEERWYRLRADLVGSYVLPPVTVSYRLAGEPSEATAAGAGGGAADEQEGEVQTSEIFVEVESVLPADGEVTDIRDIKPLARVESPVPWRWILGTAGAVLVLSGAAFLWWRRRSPHPAPPTPPHVLAFHALDELRRSDFGDPEAVRRYYFAISEVLRTYVERRFGLNATDLTTEEIVPRLTAVDELDSAQSGRLESFLLDTDQVKFAAHRPSEDEIEQSYERALGFVEATRPMELEAAPGA